MTKPIQLKSCLKRVVSSPFTPFVVVLIILTLCHLTFIIGPDDADTFAAAMKELNPWGFVSHFYSTWSSRQMLETTEAMFGLMPKIIWQLVNPFMATALVMCISYIAGLWRNTQANWVLCALLLIYPWETLNDAGWVSTTLVYLWPCVLGLVALLPFAKMLANNTLATNQLTAAPTKPWVYVLCTVALLYGANNEQMLAFLLLSLACICIWFFLTQKRIPWFAGVQLSLCVAMLIYIVTAPGNSARITGESVSFFKNFSMLSILEKLEMGISLTLSSVVFKRDLIFFFFTLILALALWYQSKKWYYRVIGLIPFVITAVLGMYQHLFLKIFPQLAFFTNAYSGQGIINLSNCNILTAYIPLLLLGCVAALCIVNLYLAFGHNLKSVIAILCFVFAFGTRVAIGMSPTIGVSGGRTGLFFSFALIALSGALYALLPLKARAKIWFCPLLAAYCALQIYSLAEL